MRFEKKLNLGIAAEEIAHTDNPTEAQPNHRAIFDAIHKLLNMDMDSLYDFATSGGYIEEDTVVITKVPINMLAEQIVRTVHTGNYTRVLEVKFNNHELGQPDYVGYIIVKLGVSDSVVNFSFERAMASWKPGSAPPFVYYETETQALRAMGAVEDKEAAKAPMPIKPSAKPPKPKAAPAADVKQAAIQMATRMGKKQAIPALQKMSLSEIVNAAKRGKEQSQINYWTIGKYVFLAYLALQTVLQGLSGLAALIIGYFAVLSIEHLTRVGRPPQK